MRKAAVISNCQARPIADFLRVRLPDFSFEVVGVHLLRPDQIARNESDVLGRVTKDCDLVITAPLSGSYGALATDKLERSLERGHLVIVPNIYFSGLHPDLTYLGGLGQRLQGPIGDYHSKIAVAGFLSGMSVKKTCAMYNDRTYSKLEYYTEFQSSLSELRRREESVDFKVSDIIEENILQKPCFMTVNHPTSYLFSRFVDGLVQYMVSVGLVGDVYPPIDYHYRPNPLADAAIFPVFPEIADFHQLKYEGNYLFKAPRGNLEESVYDLEDFVEREYQAFDAIPPERLSAHPVAKRAMDLWSRIEV